MDSPHQERKEKRHKKAKKREVPVLAEEARPPEELAIEPIPPPLRKDSSTVVRKISHGNVEAILEPPADFALPQELSLRDLCVLTELPVDKSRTDRLKSYGVVKVLGSNWRSGLPASELAPEALERRKAKYGANEVPPPSTSAWFALWVEALQDKVIIILAVAAVVSIVLGTSFPPPGEAQAGWIEGVAIVIAILVVTLVTSINNYIKEQKFKELVMKSRTNVKAKVIRNDVAVDVAAPDVLVGDVIELKDGDAIPADGLFLSGADFQADESSMTGESLPVHKSPEAPFLLAGCNAVEGSCRMVVTSVGVSTEYGRTLAATAVEIEETPLQMSLEEMVDLIGWVGIGVAGLVFMLLTLYWTIGVGTEDAFYSWQDFIQILQYFIIAITVVVVAVPEGLPLAVTICLAYSVGAMEKDNNYVIRMASCEVMGGCTNICSDKTGTLTENRMMVVAGWIATRDWSEGSTFDRNAISRDVFGMLTEGICVNSKVLDCWSPSLTSQADINKVEGSDLPQFVGNPTECAMLGFLAKNDINYRSVRDGNKTVHTYPFKSARKRMSTVIEAGDGFRLHCKGASEMVLSLSSYYMAADGAIHPLNAQVLATINAKIDHMANNSLRTLGVAYRDFGEPLEWAAIDPPEERLIFIAVLGILDPLRAGVPDAVRVLQNAGIIVRMVTGDNLTTAKKIAEQCGIYTPKNGGIALEGPEFARIYANNPEDIDPLLPNLQVLARSSPTDKYSLVKRLRKNGQIVAVTGDGTNDAKALKSAHVGLAMGIAGTEVAKAAAAILILDDNFNSIVKTVMWGRNVFDCIRKFLQFQLTVNLAALLIVLIGSASNQGSPLKAVQLLWVNLIMDSFAALALATEKPTLRLLQRLPINVLDTRTISNKMLKHIVGQALWQVAVLLVILYVPGIFQVKHLSNAHYSVIFNVFVWMQIFNEINSRKLNDELNVFEGFFSNYIFLGVMAVTVIGQVLIIEVGGPAFQTAPLNWWQWLVSIAFGLTSLLVGFLLRLIPTKDDVKRTPYNVELTPEQLAKRLKRSVRPKDKENSVVQPLLDERERKKNDLEV